jgi:hypothetical protein
MIMDQLEMLKGQSVEVVYNSVVYRGILTGVSEEEVYLQTPMEWVSLPLDGIVAVRKASG